MILNKTITYMIYNQFEDVFETNDKPNIINDGEPYFYKFLHKEEAVDFVQHRGYPFAVVEVITTITLLEPGFEGE